MPKDPTHSEACHCSTCAAMAAGVSEAEAIAQHRAWQAVQMLEYGWFFHLVTGAGPLGQMALTFGLPESFDHPNLQTVLPLPPRTLATILHTIVDRIKAGEKFHAGDLLEAVINRYPVLLVDAAVEDIPVLRLIFPDEEGEYEEGKIAGDLARQYADRGSE